MRAIVLILVASAISTAAFSQGNLQFNQPILLEYTTTLTSSITVTTNYTITVPAGKVWKIESANGGITYIQSGISYATYGPNIKIHLNGAQIFEGDASSPVLPMTFPIWLPAGSYIIRTEAQSPTSGLTNIVAKYLVSGIEFNIVP